MEVLIEAAERFPHVPPRHKERARWLFHGAGLIQISVQITIPAIHRIGWP
jgi:hypothetical protein